MIILCGIPGCVRHGATVPGSDLVRCAIHFWDALPVPEPPEDARAEWRFWEPET